MKLFAYLAISGANASLYSDGCSKNDPNLATVAQVNANWSKAQSLLNNEGEWGIAGLANNMELQGSGYGWKIKSATHDVYGMYLCSPGVAPTCAPGFSGNGYDCKGKLKRKMANVGR